MDDAGFVAWGGPAFWRMRLRGRFGTASHPRRTRVAPANDPKMHWEGAKRAYPVRIESVPVAGRISATIDVGGDPMSLHGRVENGVYAVRGDAMTSSYETLDEYLDDLDAIKEKVADKTRGMNAKQVKAYFS